MEPLLSLNQARAALGALKGVKRISYPALVRLVKKEGLPTVPNPFNPGAWAFQQSLIDVWFEDYTAGSNKKPLRGPGRPNTKNEAARTAPVSFTSAR